MKQFIPALKFVNHAVAKKDVRFYLYGVLLYVVSDHTVRLVGTDGHRLAKIDLDVPDHGMPIGQYILSADLVRSILTTFKAKDVDIAFEFDGLDVTVSTSDAKIFGKLIDGKYPDYEAVIPDLDADVVDVYDEPIDWSDPATRRVGVNCRYLEEAFKACKWIVGKDEDVVLHMRGSLSSMVITISDNAMVIIMPMKL